MELTAIEIAYQLDYLAVPSRWIQHTTTAAEAEHFESPLHANLLFQRHSYLGSCSINDLYPPTGGGILFMYIMLQK